MNTTAHQISTHYQRLGKGPILVMLHGWGCDWQIFAPIIHLLSENFQLVIPDLPAFGQSHAPTQAWDTKDYSAWLTDFLTQVIGNKPYSLLGHSYGGKVAALYVATGQGPQPQQLLLCDASGIPTPLSLTKRVQQKILGLIPKNLKQRLPTKIRHQLLTLSGSSTDHFYSSPMQQQILRTVVSEDLRPILPQIQVPTLLLWGEVDLDTPLSHAQQFESLIPGAELATFAGVGHFPFIDQPTRFIAEVTSFCLKS